MFFLSWARVGLFCGFLLYFGVFPPVCFELSVPSQVIAYKEASQK